MLYRDKCLGYHFLNFSHDLLRVKSIALESLEHFLERSLMAGVIIHVLCHLKVLVLFVYCIVCKMHEEIIHGVLIGIRIDRTVLMGGESYYTFLVEEYF